MLKTLALLIVTAGEWLMAGCGTSREWRCSRAIAEAAEQLDVEFSDMDVLRIARRSGEDARRVPEAIEQLGPWLDGQPAEPIVIRFAY